MLELFNLQYCVNGDVSLKKAILYASGVLKMLVYIRSILIMKRWMEWEFHIFSVK